jgi:hypothetical protein
MVRDGVKNIKCPVATSFSKFVSFSHTQTGYCKTFAVACVRVREYQPGKHCRSYNFDRKLVAVALPLTNSATTSQPVYQYFLNHSLACVSVGRGSILYLYSIFKMRVEFWGNPCI